MADTPARGGGAFNWRSPGFKEYAIVFVVALGGLYLYNRFKGGSTTPAASSGTTASNSPTGLSTSSLMLWIQDHASSPAGLYFHAHPRTGTAYFSQGGRKVTEPSGQVDIGGSQYYYHSDPKHGGAYFSQNGKRVSPPSGSATSG